MNEQLTTLKSTINFLSEYLDATPVILTSDYDLIDYANLDEQYEDVHQVYFGHMLTEDTGHYALAVSLRPKDSLLTVEHVYGYTFTDTAMYTLLGLAVSIDYGFDIDEVYDDGSGPVSEEYKLKREAEQCSCSSSLH